MAATLNTPAQAAEKITCVKRTGEVTAQYLSTWTNINTGRCLAVRGASSCDGSPAFQFDCLGYADQRWFITDAYDSVGHHLYSFAINNYTGRCLAVRSANNVNGAPAFQHDCVTSYSDQQWKIRNA
ncbi:Ricin-type beta-trefoil lectin domain-like [Lentzea waywayandensis]|uniref:Ricin-type beta-trefoil lectin domain-like n=1 Tax=Lentzea waywayandensis TaxID=84724 RepID=A0A1I6ECB9_9PSEU|nr:RICIN domain-containing protein [Lentzea waywayandensis]SFR15221.1 Ricin-type beta-trefoil lectin domain-like [Lentzea waywayandensis]